LVSLSPSTTSAPTFPGSAASTLDTSTCLPDATFQDGNTSVSCADAGTAMPDAASTRAVRNPIHLFLIFSPLSLHLCSLLIISCQIYFHFSSFPTHVNISVFSFMQHFLNRCFFTSIFMYYAKFRSKKACMSIAFILIQADISPNSGQKNYRCP